MLLFKTTSQVLLLLFLLVAPAPSVGEATQEEVTLKGGRKKKCHDFTKAKFTKEGSLQKCRTKCINDTLCEGFQYNKTTKDCYTIESSPIKFKKVSDIKMFCYRITYRPSVPSSGPSSMPSNAPNSIIACSSLVPSSGPSSMPSKAPSSQVLQVALGYQHTCATSNGKLLCWGGNYDGQLGDGGINDRYTPVIIVLGNVSTRNAVQLAVGYTNTCAISDDDKLFCWGNNQFGQIGDGTTITRYVPTTTVDLGNVSTRYAVQVSLGFQHTCAISNDDKLFCWGYNAAGQLGDGTTTARYTPSTSIVLGNDPTRYAVQVSLGYHHTCAISNDNKLFCWGDNGYYQVGDGTYVSPSIPTIINLDNDPTRYAVRVALGAYHTCAISNDNKLFCWGDNATGQIGDGTTNTIRSTPTLVDLNDPFTTTRYAAQLAVGDSFTCVISNDNKLLCWGSGYYGRLADGTYTDSPTPTIIILDAADTSRYAAQVSLGFGHACAISNDDKLFCWGYNQWGQIGDGTFGTTNVVTPTLTDTTSF
jgi:alpha-tubulin suppressor-like RCC1 family protein